MATKKIHVRTGEMDSGCHVNVQASDFLLRSQVIIFCLARGILDLRQLVSLGHESLAERDRLKGCHIPVKQVDLLE